MMDNAQLRGQIEALIVLATGRAISVEELRGCGGSLELVGVNSIAYINLIEALARRYAVVVDPETDPESLTTVDAIVALVRTRAGSTGAAAVATRATP
jgi:hypothetical protein